jgi:hypothetical protein
MECEKADVEDIVHGARRFLCIPDQWRQIVRVHLDYGMEKENGCAARSAEWLASSSSRRCGRGVANYYSGTSRSSSCSHASA